MRRIIASVLLFFFIPQSMLLAESSRDLSVKEKSYTLQVESFFTNDKYINQLKVEFRFLKEMLSSGKDIPSIATVNAMLDECYDGYGRILSLKKTPVWKKNNRVSVELELLLTDKDNENLRKKIKEMIEPIADEYDEKANLIKITYGNKRVENGNNAVFQELQKEKYIKSFDDAKIAYNVTGSGKQVILLVHYWGGNKKMWDRLLNVILKKSFFQKYTIIRLDLRGFGNSELKGSAWKNKKKKEEFKKLFGSDRFLQSLYVKYCSEDIKRILKKEKISDRPGFEGVNLMGHSLGGMVSMEFALEFPALTKSLALINTSSDPVYTFSPITFLPGSTWVVKKFLRTIATITERVLFAYEDVYTKEKAGIDIVVKTINNISDSTEFKFIKFVLKVLPGSTYLIKQCLKYVLRISREIAQLNNGLFEDIIPLKVENIGEDFKARFFSAIKKSDAFSWVLKRIVLDGEDQQVVDEILDAFEKVNFYVLVHTFFALTFISFPENVLVKQLNCPVLVVRGMKDLVTGRESFWALLIKELRRLAIVSGKHMSPQEYPRDLADIIGWFLRTSEKGEDDEALSMDSKTEEQILSGKPVQITSKRAEQVVLKKEDGVYSLDEIGKGFGDIKESLIILMQEVDTEVSNELYDVFTAKSYRDFIPGSKGSFGKGDNYLYIKDGKLAGFLNFIVDRTRGGYTVEGKLAVHPLQQDAGAGYKLLDYAISASKEKYPKFNGFILKLSPGEKFYFQKYFERRTKNKKADLPLHLKAISSKSGFNVEIIEYTNEDSLQLAENVIRNSNNYSKLATSSVINSLSKIKENKTPVDIIIDLSLVPSKDCKENMTTWAHLVLGCRNLENINFIFRDPHNLDIFDSNLDYDVCDIKTTPTITRAINDLRQALLENAGSYGLDDVMLKEIFDRCIDGDRRDNAIVIPIVSTVILNSAIRDKLKLKTNVFPVAMDGTTYIKRKGEALRNYQAALTISLVKAGLVMAKKSGEEDLRSMIKEVLPRLNKLYKIIKNKELEGSDLIYMIASNPVQRLRFAIEFSIPEIIRMPYNDLPVLHDVIHSYLSYA